MPQNLLEQLRKFSVIVVDTGDIEAMERFKPRDATTNPSHITNAAKMPKYQPILDGELIHARKELGASASDLEVANLAFRRLGIAWGKNILNVVPGRVSTEVDARLSYDTEGTIAQARGIIAQYEAEGISRERILVKIAATWEGTRAARVLEKEGIHCNLTLIFATFQAVAAAEAGATLVSPFCGRVLDWYKKETGRDYFGAEDPGVIHVSAVYNYFKKYGFKTEVMGASFWNVGQVRELAGADLLTIAPKVLAELEAIEEELTPKLNAEAAKAMSIEKIVVDSKEAFERLLAANRMATDKLKEGIEGFSAALVDLETLLVKRLAEIESRTATTA
ncbi:MAG: transaldolase [Terracidiphilus sp.]